MTKGKAVLRRLALGMGLIAMISSLGAPARADPRPDAGVQADIVRWNAIWEPGNDNRTTVHGWTATDLAQKNGQMAGLGFRMISLTHADTTGNGSHRYDAIWKPGTEQTAVLIGWSEAQFVDAIGFYWGQGLRLHRMNRYPVYNGAVTFLYDAIFKPGTDGRRVVWGWSLAGLKAEDAAQRAKGNRLIQAAGTTTSTFTGSVTYIGIWAPGNDLRPTLFRATWNELSQANANHWAIGYRLKYLNINRETNANYYYDAIWEPGGDGRPFITGWTIDSLIAKNAEFWAAGYRMTVSQPYKSHN